MDKILIVSAHIQQDGEMSAAALLTKQLTRNGYDAMAMPFGPGVFVGAKVSAPDLIVLDDYLPENREAEDEWLESVFDVCKKLKERKDTMYIPVLIITGQDSHNFHFRAIEAGADDYMCKTLDADFSVLLSKVKTLLRIKHLSDQMIRQYEELEAKNEILNLQLNMAMQVQRSLLQDFDFMKNGVHILTKYLPAFEIGGDFYDIIDLDDEKTAVVIGDVSGHGISAALLTAMLNMMIKTFAPRYFDPGEFLSRMNAEFCTIFESTDSQMYACMFYAVIDTVKKEICFANAGQALPIFVDCERGEAYDLDSFGTPVGLLKGSDYEKKIISYNDNDILFLHTDGLADNLYKNNEDDFYPRVKSMLVDMKDDVAPKTIVSTLLNVFYKHDVSPKMKYELDDVSIIVCKFGETAEADETESGGAAEAKDKAGEKAARQIQQGARNV